MHTKELQLYFVIEIIQVAETRGLVLMLKIKVFYVENALKYFEFFVIFVLVINKFPSLVLGTEKMNVSKFKYFN